MKMAQSCGGEALSLQGAVVKALVCLVMERPLTLFAAKTGETHSDFVQEDMRAMRVMSNLTHTHLTNMRYLSTHKIYVACSI